MNKKLFSIDSVTLALLESICMDEGLNASDLLRLLIRAWQMSKVCDNKFPSMTTWTKAKFTSALVKQELAEIRKAIHEGQQPDSH